MLRRTRRLPKFKALVHRLGGSEYRAVGALEGVWHLTAESAPNGAIGRFSNEEIEIALGWDGERGALIRALLETRWLDEILEANGRLYVHDWHEWADDSVQRAMVR